MLLPPRPAPGLAVAVVVLALAFGAAPGARLLDLPLRRSRRSTRSARTAPRRRASGSPSTGSGSTRTRVIPPRRASRRSRTASPRSSRTASATGSRLLARVPVERARPRRRALRTRSPETVHTSGFSDPEIYGQLRLWASPLSRRSRPAVVRVAQRRGQDAVGRRTTSARTASGSTSTRSRAPAPPTSSAASSLLYLIDAPVGALRLERLPPHGRERLRLPLREHLHRQRRVRAQARQSLDGVLELNFRHAKKDRVDARRHARRRHRRLAALPDAAAARRPRPRRSCCAPGRRSRCRRA